MFLRYSVYVKYIIVQIFLILVMFVCTICSVLSKENGIALPAMCTVWHFIYLLYYLNTKKDLTIFKVTKNIYFIIESKFLLVAEF